MKENRSAIRSNRTKLLACGFAIFLIIIVALLLLKHGQKAGDSADASKPKPVVVNTAVATIRPMDTVVSAQGTLVPSQGGSAKVSAVSAGRLIDVRVREGQHVVAGEVVAVVDSRVQQAQAQSAVSALRASQIQAEQSGLAVRAASNDRESAVKVARLELETAKTELRKLQNGARPQEVAQADQSVKQTQATRDRAITELDRVEFLFKKGIVAKRQLDDAKTALAVADSSLESAKQQASLVRSGTRSEDIHTARLRVEAAKASLRQAENGSLQIAAKQREMQASIESIQQKRADLAAAQAAAGLATLRSPINGIVAKRNLNPGDMADTTTPVVEIVNSNSLDMSASIPADEGLKIKAGMPARIMLASDPHKFFPGRVMSIGQIDPASGLLSVRIAVANPGSHLAAGAFVTADIVLATNASAVVVPKEAILTREGGSVVFVKGYDGVAHQRRVKTGVEQGQYVEIKSGIKQGEEVICLGQYELSDGVKVQNERRYK